ARRSGSSESGARHGLRPSQAPTIPVPGSPRSGVPGTAFALRSRQRLANPLGGGFELERPAGHLVEHLVRSRLLPLGPELAQQRARVLAREPGIAERLAQIRAQLRLERPRAQVARRVE